MDMESNDPIEAPMGCCGIERRVESKSRLRLGFYLFLLCLHKQEGCQIYFSL